MYVLIWTEKHIRGLQDKKQEPYYRVASCSGKVMQKQIGALVHEILLTATVKFCDVPDLRLENTKEKENWHSETEVTMERKRSWRLNIA